MVHCILWNEPDCPRFLNAFFFLLTDKASGFTEEALRGLASKEDFSRVKLKKVESSSSPVARNQPFKEKMLLLVKGQFYTPQYSSKVFVLSYSADLPSIYKWKLPIVIVRLIFDLISGETYTEWICLLAVILCEFYAHVIDTLVLISLISQK